MAETLLEQLIRHEGLKLKPYRCTAGKLTIGVGRNLEDMGITKDEALYMLRADIARCYAECKSAFSWFAALTEARQNVLVNMCFNMGIARLKEFKKMLAAAHLGEYEDAAREMLDSAWAGQVGDRAKELAEQMQRG